MAEGGEFGMDQPDLDHDIDHDDDDDDDDDDEQEVNTTRPFYPGSASTPYHGGEQHEMQTMQHEQSGLPDTSYDETPLLGSAQSAKERAWGVLKGMFPESSSTSLEASYSLKGRLQVKMAGAGKKLYDLFTTKRGTGEQQLNPDLSKELRRELGPMAQKVVERDNEELRNDRQRLKETEKHLNEAEKETEKQLKEYEKLVSEKEKSDQEVKNIRIRLERTQATIDALNEEHGTTIDIESENRRLKQLKKNLKNDLQNAQKENAALDKLIKTKTKVQTDVEQLRVKVVAEREKIAAKERERNTVQERLNDTRTLDELKEQEAELQRQNEEDQAVIDNETALPSEKQAAEGRVEERQEELARLRTQIDERERALPLRERVKEIFKKYGVTVTAIVLAAGVTIGAVVGAITNALKATGKALGKGLKDIGSKLASILPGLIGSIVSFLFKAAGQAIGFLAEHTWLLILAVVAFLVEKYIKKRR